MKSINHISIHNKFSKGISNILSPTLINLCILLSLIIILILVYIKYKKFELFKVSAIYSIRENFATTIAQLRPPGPPSPRPPSPGPPSPPSPGPPPPPSTPPITTQYRSLSIPRTQTTQYEVPIAPATTMYQLPSGYIQSLLDNYMKHIKTNIFYQDKLNIQENTIQTLSQHVNDTLNPPI